jgi:hypothetical protein
MYVRWYAMPEDDRQTVSQSYTEAVDEFVTSIGVVATVVVHQALQSWVLAFKTDESYAASDWPVLPAVSESIAQVQD